MKEIELFLKVVTGTSIGTPKLVKALILFVNAKKL
jgi:hypothetical protein